MAKFYTPSPFINFQGMPSDAQRMVDTMKEIKTEKREDEAYEMKKRQAELAYQEGMLQLNAAKMKMDDVARSQQLDQEAAQVFNSVMSANGTRTDALKAVGNLMLQKGGWSKYSEFQNDLKSKIKEGLEIAKLNPKAAQGVADLINTNFPADQHITGEQLAQRLASSEAIKVDNEGNFAQIDPTTGELKVVNLASPEMRAEQQRKANLEEREARREERDSITRANRAADTAELARLRLQAVQDEKDRKAREAKAKETRRDKLKFLDKNIDKMDKAAAALARPTKDNLLSALAAFNGVSTGDVQTDKRELQRLYNDSITRTQDTIDELKASGDPDTVELTSFRERALQSTLSKISGVAKAPAGGRLKARVDQLKGNKPAPTTEMDSEWGQLLPTDVRNQGY